ncbi:MAG: hypothetical protein O7F69_10905 [Alphaproteobacteria bacterium]|nr:hypothetical protein [Alphaproteobacteria bacterium]
MSYVSVAASDLAAQARAFGQPAEIVAEDRKRTADRTASEMPTSTRLSHMLNIQSVAGIAVSISVLLVFMAVAMFGTPEMDIYVAICFSYFIGLPLHGILYVGLKLHKHLGNTKDQ